MSYNSSKSVTLRFRYIISFVLIQWYNTEWVWTQFAALLNTHISLCMRIIFNKPHTFIHLSSSLCTSKVCQTPHLCELYIYTLQNDKIIIVPISYINIFSIKSDGRGGKNDCSVHLFNPFTRQYSTIMKLLIELNGFSYLIHAFR